MMKLDLDIDVGCVHSLLPPMLTHATGGILTAPDSDEPIAVICGGEDLCQILTESDNDDVLDPDFSLSSGGLLNMKRSGAASLIIDNGSTVWVIGGVSSSDLDAVRDTEFVTISRTSSMTNPGFPTNGAGPQLYEGLAHHCVVKVGPKKAILVGGGKSTSEDGT